MNQTRRAIQPSAIFSSFPSGLMRLIVDAPACGRWRLFFTSRDILAYKLSLCATYFGMPKHFRATLLEDFDEWAGANRTTDAEGADYGRRGTESKHEATAAFDVPGLPWPSAVCWLVVGVIVWAMFR